MNETNSEAKHELDCEITVNDGSYMTCDMIEEADSSENDHPEDYHI